MPYLHRCSLGTCWLRWACHHEGLLAKWYMPEASVIVQALRDRIASGRRGRCAYTTWEAVADLATRYSQVPSRSAYMLVGWYIVCAAREAEVFLVSAAHELLWMLPWCSTRAL